MQLVKKERNSNLELFRIIVMMLIVAHHYVVNSGLYQVMQNSELTSNSIFLYIIGMWGKTGIDCFVLITGYFMCKSEATVHKFLKLLLEVEFYKVVIYFIFLGSGYIDFELKTFIKALLPIGHVGDGFTTGFILFYPFIPFLNKLIQNLNKRQHAKLIALVLFIYTIVYMTPGLGVTFNYVTWFIILYFISSYIRLYPIARYDKDTKFWGTCTLASIVLSIASVFILRAINMGPYRMVSDSNAILAIITAVCSFMYFKDLNIKHNKIINQFGAATFGVLLIHANSNAMRQWLWKDTLQNTSFFDNQYLWIHTIGSVICVFFICALIDIIRIKFIETPFFKTKFYNNIVTKIESILK